MVSSTAAKAQAEPASKRIRTQEASTMNEARVLLSRVKNVNKAASEQSREDASVALGLLEGFASHLPKQISQSLPRKFLTQRRTKTLHG